MSFRYIIVGALFLCVIPLSAQQQDRYAERKEENFNLEKEIARLAKSVDSLAAAKDALQSKSNRCKDEIALMNKEIDSLDSLLKGANILKSTCPTCGLPMISIKKKGQKGREHVCLDPNCGKEVSKRRAPEVVGTCPECGRDLLKRSGRYGDFVGCSGFPQCRFTCQVKDLDNLGKEKAEAKENNSK